MQESISSQDKEFVDIPGKEPFQINRLGEVKNKITGRILTNNISNNGYYNTGTTVDGVYKTIYIHRSLALTFIPNPQNKPQINHIDGVKTNNSLDNLEWVTSQENAEHAVKMGLRNPSKGEDHYYQKYPEDTIHSICKDIQNGIKNSEIMKKYNVPRWIPSELRLGKKWKHITSQYNLQRSNRKTLEDSVLKEICELLISSDKSYKEIAEQFELKVYTIQRIAQKKIYKNFVKNYDFSIRFND